MQNKVRASRALSYHCFGVSGGRRLLIIHLSVFVFIGCVVFVDMKYGPPARVATSVICSTQNFICKPSLPINQKLSTMAECSLTWDFLPYYKHLVYIASIAMSSVEWRVPC